MSTCNCRLILASAILLLFGCSASPRFAQRGGGAPPPERAAGEPATSRTSSTGVLLSLEGVASYYADDFNGKQAANGEIFDMNDMTAAHRTFPFGTRVRVTNLANRRSVVVRVIDRGPFKEGRLIDLSLAAARAIDLVREGTGRVRLDVLEWGDGMLYHNR